ncbi:MAG: NusG domain II-containing protein [Clostridia bacterium]|nr:NusG domain II-containing protein [Clostridia bacterium]
MTKTDGKKLKNDIIFVSVLLFVISVIGVFYFFFRGEGDTVTVTVARECYGEYALDEDRVLEIRTEHSLNTLVICDGKAYMETADCPDGICTDHRPIFRDGESIICLPNQVVVTVTAKDGEEPDIVA